MKFDCDPNEAIEKVESLVSAVPETTCGHRGICCRAGCPNMTFGEYIWISRDYVEKLSKDERLELLMRCVKNYIEPQDPTKWRPCPLLTNDMMCKVYHARPFRCRTYGLIPEKLYRNMVERVEKDTGIPSTFTPLCIQCKLVKLKPEFADRYPDGKIPEQMIKDIESQLKENDRKLGVEQKVQDAGFSYLTFHDWHLLMTLGDQVMESMTTVRLQKDKVAKEHFLVLLKQQIADSLKGEADGRQV
jgi:Fe-S-cluster containining protein